MSPQRRKSTRKKGAAAHPQWTVDAASVGLRLDKYLAGAGRLESRSRAVTALERGKVFVNGAEASLKDAGKRVAAGDHVRVWMDRPGSAHRRPSGYRTSDLVILYEDDDLIAVDKPAGLLTVPLPLGDEAPSVVDYLEDHLRSHQRRRPLVVHRIDRDTSGVVIFAKHPAAHAALKGQFLRQEPQRVYLAVVYGQPSPAEGTWKDRLVWDQRSLIQKETHPQDPQGKEATSHYRTVERFAHTSLIEVRLVTGKRNQIRIQARLRGHTLVGERRYVFGPDDLRTVEFARQALHALRLELRHPTSGETLTFESPVPEDLRTLLRKLRAGKAN